MIHIKKFEAIKTDCQTPDAIYSIEIGDKSIFCKVDIPFSLNLDEEEAILLENNIHNAMELVLSKYFIEWK